MNNKIEICGSLSFPALEEEDQFGDIGFTIVSPKEKSKTIGDSLLRVKEKRLK